MNINTENCYRVISEYINNNNININDYKSLYNIYLNMIKEEYIFTVDYEKLMDIFKELAYKFNPSDNNKNIIINTFELLNEEI